MIIECRQLEKSYSQKKAVLDGLDLAVNEGEIFGLVGMNGSGKSTLIKAILDLVSIDGGRIWIQGKTHREVMARKNIAYLPDRFSPPAHLRSTDFIQYMLRLHGTRAGKPQIEQVLQGLELDPAILQETVNRLSKGMTQKIGLASCLLSGKSLLILDEPMSGLDPRARVLFKQRLAEYRQQGKTVFFSSHMLADIEEMADSMAVLHQGRIRFNGSPVDFKQQFGTENVEQAYMKCIEA